MYILGGLGSDFESVVVNLTSRDAITLQEVQYLLQTHKMRLEQLADTSLTEFSNSEVFFTHKQSGPAFNTFRGHPAHFRGRYGHRGRGRSSPGGRYYPSSGANNKPHCQICGKPGHTAMKCFHRFDDSYQHQSQSSRGSSASISSFPTASHASQAYIASPKDVKDTSWFLDSGATHHVANRGDSLRAKNEYSRHGKLMIGDGTELPITHVGNINLANTGIFPKSIALRSILLVPSITKNLISISKFTVDNNVIVEFNPSCYVKDIHTRNVLLKGTLNNGLYQLHLPLHSSCSASPDFKSTSFLVAAPTSSKCAASIDEFSGHKHSLVHLWHTRLGHPCCFLKNKAIPHRLDVGFAPSFPPIKGGSPSIINYTSPHPLKSICSITQLFWVFTFCLNFLGN